MLIKSSLPSPPVNIGYKSCGKINEGDFRFWVIPETSPQYCLVVSVLNSHAPMLVSGDFVEAGPQNPSSTKPPETSQDGWKKKTKKAEGCERVLWNAVFCIQHSDCTHEHIQLWWLGQDLHKIKSTKMPARWRVLSRCHS